MRHKKSTVFFCFPPPVMIATAVIELGLLLYTLVRYKLTLIVRLIMAILFFLAAFQIAEYNVCGGMGLQAQAWSRIGFMVIATLPALGVQTILAIAKASMVWLEVLAWAAAGYWIVLFGLSNNAFSGYKCGGNYIIFQIRNSYGLWYGIHYYFWLFVGIGLALWLAGKAHGKIKQALNWFVIGYGVFIIPTAVVNTLNPQTTAGLPSILCGFAVVFAVLLGVKITPLVATTKRLTNKHKRTNV